MSIEKETLIYASLPFKKYRWISYYSFIQLGFLTINLLVLPIPRLVGERQEALKNKVTKKPEQDEVSSNELEDEHLPNTKKDSRTVIARLKNMDYSGMFSFRNIVENVTERPYISLGMLGAASLISTAFWFYARRSVHMITLLPQEQVRLSFFCPFAYGKPPTIEVPLRNISCVSPRSSETNYSILKIRDYRGYHLVHKQEGKFLQPELYDAHLGYARSWHQK